MMSPLRIVIALLIGGALVFGLHFYLWARLVRDTALPAPWGAALTWALVALGVSILGSAVASRFVGRSVAQPAMWIVYVWLGLLFFLVVQFAAVDLARLLVVIARRVASAGPIDEDRRTFLARVIGGGVALATVGLGGVATYSALQRVAVKQVTAPLARLPESMRGYKIVQLTDVHVGPTIGKDFIEQLVATVNALQPDLVAITGDLVDGSVADLGPLVAPLAKLRAKDGVFFVTGNHEYYSGADEWLAFLLTLGVRVLRNAHARVGERDGNEGFDIAGVDDWTAQQSGLDGHGADLPRALAGRDASRALVLLAHQPKAILEAETLGVGLQLSGHTHGGQLFPFNYAVRLQQPYVAGLHRHGRAMIYVSNGTGYWGPPMRLGAPAEVTEIELVPA